MGVTMIRSEGRIPLSLIKAANRVGLLVEQRIVPRPRFSDPEQGGGLASAYVIAEAVDGISLIPLSLFGVSSGRERGPHPRPYQHPPIFR